MTPLPAPPRAIQPTHPAPIGKAIARLFLFAVILATLLLTLALIHELALRYLGHRTNATLSSIQEQRTSSGSYKWVARYTYALPNRTPRDDESHISWTAYRRLSLPFIVASQPDDNIVFPPDKAPSLTVRAHGVGSLAYSRPVEHEWDFAFLLIPALFAPTGMLLSLALYLAIILRPRWCRQLYTHGAAVPGVITGKRTISTKHGYLYYVYYAFTPEGKSSSLDGATMVAGAKEYESAAEGAQVTVLYAPEKPKRNVMYDYGGYRWA